MENIKLRVIDFTEYPGPRYQRQGDFSGEEFYVKKLNSAFTQAYREEKKLEVYLDGTAGYPSSFLDESFGELVYDFTLEIVKKRLLIITELTQLLPFELFSKKSCPKISELGLEIVQKLNVEHREVT